MCPSSLDFTGPVTYHLPDNDLNVRMFGIDLSIYKEKQGSQIITETCRVLCMLDDGSPRWTSYKVPALNRMLHITGTIFGFYKPAGHCSSLCLIISELSYISAAPIVSPTPTSTPSSSSQGRLKVWSGITTSPLASKKRRLSTPESHPSSSTTLPDQRRSESPSPSILGQLQRTVEESKHESSGTRPKRRNCK